MKRFFIFAAMAIAAIGCQKVEVKNEVLTPIGFNTEAGKQTRAIVTGNALPNGSTFGVYAYLHDTNAGTSGLLMNDQVVTNEGATTGATYYWPNDPNNYIDFYAYYPKSAGAAMGTEGTLSLNFDNSANYWGDAAVDFMVATPVKEAKYTTQNQGKVAVDFKHQLTQVKFAVQVPTTGTYTLKSIKLNGVTTKATYTNTFASAATWTAPTTGTVVAYPLTDTEKGFPTGTVTTTAMLMIPATAATFDLEYTVLSNGVTETVKHNIEIPTTNAWTANHSITYTISLAGAQVISFTPTVTGWDTVTPDTFVIE